MCVCVTDAVMVTSEFVRVRRYVTLGANEKRDVAAVMAFLRSEASPFMVEKIALWGRSMGECVSFVRCNATDAYA